MLKNGRPYHLPQISAPYTIVLGKLDDEGVDYELTQLHPNENDEINPSQNVIFGDEVSNVVIKDENPIWLAGIDKINICDGHHRYFKGLLDNIPVIAVKIKMDFKDACRLLNKIQDIYEYEESRGLEEVEMQDAINYYGDDENQFLNSLEEDNISVQAEKPSLNQQTVVAYRKEPIKDNSVVGNFFTLSPIDGYSKYEIDFDNLLDTHVLGIMYKDGQQPVEILSKVWFPHVNFEQLSQQYNMPSINLKNKAIAEKAMKMGFDGVKYGDTLIQGLK